VLGAIKSLLLIILGGGSSCPLKIRAGLYNGEG